MSSDASSATLSEAPPPEAATRLGWFLRGARHIVSVPAMILFAAFVGFAGLARDAGIGIGEAVMMTATIWALPSMVVLVGAIKTDAPLFATSVAVSLSAVRLMPMTMALLPVLRSERTRRWQTYLAAHFVAVTAWVFGMSHLGALPRPARLPFFLGFAVTLVAVNMAVTALAYAAAGAMPAPLAAGLTLLTPLYFTVSLWKAARIAADRLALIFGILAAPLFHLLDPRFELIWTGAVAGSLAYAVGRLAGRRRPVVAEEAEP